ncbi:MAG: DMT family transporter [Anaerolineae bacterium]|nr:DMT family transporter [Anaerolineae bacterium]
MRTRFVKSRNELCGTAKKGIIWLVVSAVGYSTLVVLIKGAVAVGLNAETTLALRFSIAALVWWAILLLRRRPPWPGISLASRAVGVGAFFYATNALCYYQGTALVQSTIAAMAIAAVPAVVALLAWLFLRERLGWKTWLALVLAVAAGMMLAGGTGEESDVLGMLWLGGAVLLYSLYIVVSAPLSRSLSSAVAITYILTGAAIFFWAWGGIAGRLNFDFAPLGWAIVLGMALVPGVLAMFAFLRGSEAVGPTRAAIVNVLEPVSAVVLTVLLLGDWPTLLQCGGCLLAISSTLLVQRGWSG